VTSKPCERERIFCLKTPVNLDKMNKYLAELHADECYHVYNRTNNKELLFKDDEDRKLFLTKYAEYLLPYVETFVYCLLGNHFHFMVKVKSIEQIIKAVEEEKEGDRTVPQRKLLDTQPDCRSAHIVLKSQFTRLFTSYAMRFNKKYKREGNLFNRPFKRVKVEKESHYSYLIYYIHANSKRHGIKSDFKNYKWNSYRAMLSSNASNVNRDVVIDWFGGKSAFVEFHKQLDVTLSEIDYLIIED